MSIASIDMKQCVGCAACEQICPENCIKGTYNKMGFYYPTVDENLCIECGQCLVVCPMLNYSKVISPFRSEPYVFAVKNKDDCVRQNSSSGGVFTPLAEYFLSKNGVVFGALFDSDFFLSHKGITDTMVLDKMRGSKYLQSCTRYVFVEVKRLLQGGVPVLFTGTPCQVAALKLFLGKNYDNLFTVDLICHGVSSPAVFSCYLEMVESKLDGKAVAVEFRNKTFGWSTQTIKVCTKEYSYINCLQFDPYGYLFLHDLIQRPSCYNCLYSDVPRVSDLTLGDFWGIEKSHGDFVDNLGVSLVLVNSVQGESIFNSLKAQFDYVSSSLNECVPYNRLSSPKLKGDYRSFEKDFSSSKSFYSIVNKYVMSELLSRRDLIDLAVQKYIEYYFSNIDDISAVDPESKCTIALSVWNNWLNSQLLEFKYFHKEADCHIEPIRQIEMLQYSLYSTIAYVFSKRDSIRPEVD